MQINDGLVNLVSGMGTGRDKGGQASWYQDNLSDLQLINAYKASSLARRVVDMPAEDACREWREWQADTADIGKINAEEKRLSIQGKTMQAQRFARLFGGAALLIGTGDSDLSQPLDPRRVGLGGLRYVTLLTMRHLSPGPLSEDATSPDFGKPQSWTLNTASQTGIKIHPSRLSVSYGLEPMGDYDTTRFTGWGTSILEGGLQSVTRIDEVAGNILSLVYEAKVDVIRIPDLMQNLATRGDSYSAEIVRRLTLAATGKGINGTLILDAMEEYQQKSASFSSLDAILDRFMQLTSAAHGIPMMLLFGKSSGGLNSSGDTELRAYYDRVKVQQTLRMEPEMSVLDECIIRSALGTRPEEVHYNWKSLWQPTAKERAEVGKSLVDSMATLDSMDILPSEAIAKATVSALTESGAFPGLETAVDQYANETPDDAPSEERTEPVVRPQVDGAVITLLKDYLGG
jgi:phage-related protein (TIGR01555 family)